MSRSDRLTAQGMKSIGAGAPPQTGNPSSLSFARHRWRASALASLSASTGPGAPGPRHWPCSCASSGESASRASPVRVRVCSEQGGGSYTTDACVCGDRATTRAGVPRASARRPRPRPASDSCQCGSCDSVSRGRGSLREGGCMRDSLVRCVSLGVGRSPRLRAVRGTTRHLHRSKAKS